MTSLATLALPLLLAAGAPAEDPLAALAPLLGHWTADPDPKSPGVTGWTRFDKEAQGNALVRINHAEYPATKDRPASSHDDVMILFSEGGHLRADYVDNEGHVIHYAVSVDGASRVVLVSDAAGPGPRFRLTYSWSTKDRLDLSFEIAPPGAPEQFKPFIGARLSRAPGK
jgi:hypothetical protein